MKFEVKTIALASLNVGTFQVWSKMPAERLTQFTEDVKVNGIENVVHVDEDYTILDGHHRYEVAKELGITEIGVKVHYGLTLDEKLALAYRLNTLTREISREEKMRKAYELRREGRSQRQIAEWLGVSQMTISNWLKGFSTEQGFSVEKVDSTDGKQRPAEILKQSEIEARQETVKELRDGKGLKMQDIADTLGVSVGTIHNDVRAYEKADKQAEKARTEVKRTQTLDLLEFEAMLNEKQAPQERTDEPALSPNNKIIDARKKLLNAGIDITTNFNVVEETDAPVKEAYLSQVKSVVRSGLITLGKYADTDDNADLIAFCLEIMDKIEGGE